MKRVILVGDSICHGYTPGVQLRLAAPEIEVERIGSGDSAQALENLRTAELGDDVAVVHFNCGLHDLRWYEATESHQQELPAYETNLRGIVALLQDRTSARLIWASITPVIESRTTGPGCKFLRFERDVDAYNAVATRLMQEAGLPIDGLHAVVDQRGREACIVPDGVHMTDPGNAALADAVADAIRQAL